MSTRLSRIILVVLMAISAAKFPEAQQQPQPPHREQIPRGIETLRQSASSKTEFTLDHSMLVLASKLDADNEDLQRVIAGVDGVSIHSFRFSGSSTYDPEALGSVKEEYRAAGWKQLMNSHQKDGGPVTDLWVYLENTAVSNVAVLLSKPNEVDFVVVSGSINPIDLFRLGGHFGIPKLEGGVTVPNTKQHP